MLCSPRVVAGLFVLFALLFNGAVGKCAGYVIEHCVIEHCGNIDQCGIDRYNINQYDANPISVDRQIADRITQYRESLRQRAAEISPAFQAKVESQAEQIVADRLEKWYQGEVDINIALPHQAEKQRFETRQITQSLERHVPALPGSSLEWGYNIGEAALTITSSQTVLQSLKNHRINVMNIPATVNSFRKNGVDVSPFLRVLHTVVLRQ